MKILHLVLESENLRQTESNYIVTFQRVPSSSLRSCFIWSDECKEDNIYEDVHSFLLLGLESTDLTDVARAGILQQVIFYLQCIF